MLIQLIQIDCNTIGLYDDECSLSCPQVHYQLYSRTMYIPTKIPVTVKLNKDNSAVQFPRYDGSSLYNPHEADIDEAVIVTAADKSHFKETKDSVASLQLNLPNNTIVYYDLGLREFQVREVSNYSVFLALSTSGYCER